MRPEGKQQKEGMDFFFISFYKITIFVQQES